MMKLRTISGHKFKREHIFNTKKEAEKYVENARSYGEQVRVIRTSKGYELWKRTGDYPIR